MQEPLHKTLIIRFSSVGDVVLSSVLVRVLRQRFPHAQIDYLVKAEFSELVRYNPHLTHVLEFPRGGTFADLAEKRRQILATHYDLIVDIHDSLRSRYICLGTQRVVRINKRKLARFLLVKMKWNLYAYLGGAPSVAERYVETARDLGIRNDGKGLELFIPREAEETARNRLLAAGIKPDQAIIGICPAAHHNTKMWLKERYAEAASTLAQHYDAGIVFFGSDGEKQRCGEIETMIRMRRPSTCVANLAGRLSLLEAAATMDRCSLVITNDSGLMHIAAARKRKLVAIFGSTVKEFGFVPYGNESVIVENGTLACRPCSHIGLPRCPKGHFKCMNDISTTSVVEAAQTLLGA